MRGTILNGLRWRSDYIQRAEPSQALSRQLSQGESQAVKFITKVLGIMRKLPAVLLALPLGELSPQVTERAHTVALSAKVSSAIRSFPTTTEAVPLGKVASPQAMTEGVLPGKQAFRFSCKLYRHAKKLPPSGELANECEPERV